MSLTTSPRPAPLTPRNFNGLRYAGVSFIELEDGEILAYGHIAPTAMVEAVTAYYRAVDSQGMLTPPTVDEVIQARAISVTTPEGADPVEGPFIRWVGIQAHTPDAVPITLVAS